MASTLTANILTVWGEVSEVGEDKFSISVISSGYGVVFGILFSEIDNLEEIINHIGGDIKNLKGKFISVTGGKIEIIPSK